MLAVSPLRNPRIALFALVLAALALALAAVPLARSYSALCHTTVDTYPALVAARDQAQAAAAPSGEGSRSVAQLGAALRARILAHAIRIKQSDPIAFPAHLTAALVLGAGHCSPTSVGDQWRKAAAHAWHPLPARIAAAGLARTVGATQGDAAALDLLARYAAEEPWYAANLARVTTAYAAYASP